MSLDSMEDISGALYAAEKSGHLLDWKKVLPWNQHLRSWPRRRKRSEILGICIHHSASANQDVQKTNAYHLAPNHISAKGCPHLCYTFAISDAQEAPIWANPIESITWSQGSLSHPGDENKHLISILVMGDFASRGYRGSSEGPTSAQMDQLTWLVERLNTLLGLPKHAIFGHSDFGKARCPGLALQTWIESRRSAMPQWSDRFWQDSLLLDDPMCLPGWGADGVWGEESKAALVAYQRKHGLQPTAIRGPFELLHLSRTRS